MESIKRANINPRLLVWARKESGYHESDIAKRLHVKNEMVAGWEEGALHPTVKQVEKIAHFLHRPLSLFFLPQPPKIAPLAADYRRLTGVQPGKESPELRLAMRKMLIRRENALNLMEELGQGIPEFNMSAHLNESPSKVGTRLRVALKINVDQQYSWPTEWVAWAEWRSAIEKLGILVFQFGQISVKEVRGLTLLKTPLPVVAINNKELPEIRSFTLLHEVVHLMLAQGNEEKPAIDENRTSAQWLEIERFAEIAASHALIPEDALVRTINNIGEKTVHFNIERVRKLSKKFRVTPLAMATRLRESNYMSWTQYKHWKSEWDRYVAQLPPRKGGFSNPVEKTVNRGGRPFAQLVLEALEANRITSVEASRYLELKFEHFGFLRSYVTTH